MVQIEQQSDNSDTEVVETFVQAHPTSGQRVLGRSSSVSKSSWQSTR